MHRVTCLGDLVVAARPRPTRREQASNCRDVGAPGQRPCPPWVIAVDGRSGAGKTSLAEALAHALGPTVPVLHLDDLYPGWWGLDDGVERLREWVLAPLRAGVAGRYRHYDWTAGRYTGWRDLPVAASIVVEGVGSGAPRAEGLVDVLVWVEAGEPLRRTRARARDGDRFDAFWDLWATQEDHHLDRWRTPGWADVTVDAAALTLGTKVP